MPRLHRILAVTVASAILSFGGSTTLAGESSMPEDLNDYQCKDVMILSGEDREIALAILHGYRLGKKNTTRFAAEALAKATDNFMDYCLDHPKDKALVVFEKFTK